MPTGDSLDFWLRLNNVTQHHQTTRVKTFISLFMSAEIDEVVSEKN